MDSHCNIGDLAIIELIEPVKFRFTQMARLETKMPSLMFSSGYGYDRWFLFYILKS